MNQNYLDFEQSIADLDRKSFGLETTNPVVLKGVAGKPGTEFDLPTFSVYCALELEGNNL